MPGHPSHRHATPIRVRFGETDAMGVASSIAYMGWFEVGRIEHLRALGRSYAEVHDGGIDMVVVEAGIHYLRALRFDDNILVETRAGAVTRSTFTFEYEIRRDGELCASGFTRHACVDRATMRPVRVPAWLAELAQVQLSPPSTERSS